MPARKRLTPAQRNMAERDSAQRVYEKDQRAVERFNRVADHPAPDVAHSDADDDLDNPVIGTPMPPLDGYSHQPSVSMDRGSPIPGEPAPAEPDLDRIAAIDSTIRERHKPHPPLPAMAPRDATRVERRSDRLADQAGRDMDDAVARRTARIRRP